MIEKQALVAILKQDPAGGWEEYSPLTYLAQRKMNMGEEEFVFAFSRLSRGAYNHNMTIQFYPNKFNFSLHNHNAFIPAQEYGITGAMYSLLNKLICFWSTQRTELILR